MPGSIGRRRSSCAAAMAGPHHCPRRWRGRPAPVGSSGVWGNPPWLCPVLRRHLGLPLASQWLTTPPHRSWRWSRNYDSAPTKTRALSRAASARASAFCRVGVRGGWALGSRMWGPYPRPPPGPSATCPRRAPSCQSGRMGAPVVGHVELRPTNRGCVHITWKCLAQPSPTLGRQRAAAEGRAPVGGPRGAKPAPPPLLKGYGGTFVPIHADVKRGRREKKTKTKNVAVHQHVGMTPWQIFLLNSSAMRNGGMLQVKLLCGWLLRDFMYSFAEPILVCSHV